MTAKRVSEGDGFWLVMESYNLLAVLLILGYALYLEDVPEEELEA